MSGTPEYAEYCARIRAETLKTPPLLKPCSEYVPRPGWEVEGCHSCRVAEAQAACAELCRRFGELVPCLRDLKTLSFGGTE